MSQSAATAPAAGAPNPEDDTATEPAKKETLLALDQVPYRAFYSLPVEIVVCVGTARPPIGELLTMGRDAVIVLDRRINDPVDIRVGDRVIARGELQEVDDGSGRLGVRITEILDTAGSS
ncbi:MAG: FliM/FliN family flagellar motor switch protein [Geminicoccaceae bacterium]